MTKTLSLAAAGDPMEYAQAKALALPEAARTPEVLAAIAEAWLDGRDGIRLFPDGTVNRRKADIDDLVSSLRRECKSLGLAYDAEDDRAFSRHILTAKEFGAQARAAMRVEPGNEAEEAAMRISYAVSIVRAAYKACRSWDPVAGPKQIYRKHSKVYNEYMLTKKKESGSVLTVTK